MTIQPNLHRSSAAGKHLRPLGGVVAAMFLALAMVYPAAAQSQPAPATTDRMDLVGLSTRQPSPDSPPNRVQFHTTVNYRLQSADTGFVLLFLFENGANDSTQQSTSGIAVARGSGQMVLDIDYTLKPDVRTLTLVAGLFKGEQKMVAWVSTNPIDMGPWPGRVAFEKAMADRLDNNYAGAEQELSQAIQDAPQTGNYYYWRGDTRVRLDQYDAAVADFTRSLELMPKDRASRVGRGVARLWLGDAQGSVEDLSAALEASPTPDRITAWAYRGRGLAHTNLGQSEGAVADYKAYLSVLPAATDRAQVEGRIADLS
ncbi:MAG: tetratricopeptide repeat protein [Chloroflexota bacterium]